MLNQVSTTLYSNANKQLTDTYEATLHIQSTYRTLAQYISGKCLDEADKINYEISLQLALAS
jgi:hypothetical protein